MENYEFNDNIIINSPINQSNPSGISNGILMYVTCLPLIGLFLERVISQAFLAVILWALIIILMPVCCYADMVKVRKIGYDVSGLKKIFWLAPMYIYKRDKLLCNESFKVYACVVFCIGAVVMNGFTQGLRVNTGSIQMLAQSCSVSQLENFSGSSANVIGTQLDYYFDKDAKWSCEKDNDTYLVTASGKKGSDKYKVIIIIVFDGFAYQEFKVDRIEKNGVKIKDSELKDCLKTIFIDTKENSDSTDSE